jgi:hypothetical protein
MAIAVDLTVETIPSNCSGWAELIVKKMSSASKYSTCWNLYPYKHRFIGYKELISGVRRLLLLLALSWYILLPAYFRISSSSLVLNFFIHACCVHMKTITLTVLFCTELLFS